MEIGLLIKDLIEAEAVDVDYRINFKSPANAQKCTELIDSKVRKLAKEEAENTALAAWEWILAEGLRSNKELPPNDFPCADYLQKLFKSKE